MLEPKKTTTDRPQHGEATTRHVEGTIVDTTYHGYCSRALVQSVLDYTPEVLSSVPGTCWLLDLSACTAFDPECRVPGGDILKLFREKGGDRFAVVVTSGALRMTLAAVAFATRLPIKLFADRIEAMTWLRSRGATRPPRSGRESFSRT